MRKSPFESVQSVIYFFPSDEVIFSRTIISYNWTNPSELSFLLRSLQYLLGLLLSVSTSITSIIAKYHFCSDSFHSARICLLSKSLILLILSDYFRRLRYNFSRSL